MISFILLLPSGKIENIEIAVQPIGKFTDRPRIFCGL